MAIPRWPRKLKSSRAGAERILLTNRRSLTSTRKLLTSELLPTSLPLTGKWWRPHGPTCALRSGIGPAKFPLSAACFYFGKDRFAHFPDSWIQAGRFAGTNRARMLDSVAIRSYLPLAAEEAVAFVQKHMTNESIITGVRR